MSGGQCTMRPMGNAAQRVSQAIRVQVSDVSAGMANAAMNWKAHSTPVSTRAMSAKKALAHSVLANSVSAAMVAMFTFPAGHRQSRSGCAVFCQVMPSDTSCVRNIDVLMSGVSCLMG